MDVGGGGGFPAQFNFANGQLSVAGQQGGPGTPVQLQDGALDLNALVSALGAEGFSEMEILEHLDGIVSELESQVDLEIKGKEAYESYLSDKLEVVSGASTAGVSVTEGASESTQKLLEVFESEGIYVNPNTPPEGADSSNPAFNDAVESLNTLVADPNNPQARAEFSFRLSSYMTQFPHGDVMSSLFHVFKESIEQTNEDKRYFLERLQDQNAIAKAVGEYLEELTAFSHDVNEKTREKVEEHKGDKDFDPQTVTMDFTTKEFSPDTVTHNAQGQPQAVSHVVDSNRAFNQADVNLEIKLVEQTMEEVRNKREEFQTGFENFDQKANQLFNILSKVLQSIKEMGMGVTRNLL